LRRGGRRRRNEEGVSSFGRVEERAEKKERRDLLLSNRLLDEKIRLEVDACSGFVEYDDEVVSEESSTKGDELGEREVSSSSEFFFLQFYSPDVDLD